MDTFGNGNKDIRFAYCDENLNVIESYCTFEQLAKVITDMIARGIYKEN